ncbi:MAG: tetratricopeptide repeat protein [Candidatus Magasanikbacteria bacterium]|nr:tetratricopeptide repeat protein [Candidatus Magasanikbacteria bacterium]
MNKKILIVAVVILVLGGIGAGFYFWQLKDKKIISQQNSINLDDPNQVFNIAAPADFDANKKQRLEEKIAAAKDLYQNKKDDTWTWIVIGNMYEFVHDYDRAILAYERTLSINSSEMISLTNLGYIYEHQKNDYRKAEEYYRKAVTIYAQIVDNYLNLARLYEYKMSRLDDAEKVYLDGLKNTENNAELMVNLINFYQRQKRTNKAAEYAGQLLKLYPANQLYQNDFGALIK